MAKNATLSVRVEPELKEEAIAILSSIGISTSSAVNMFFRQVVINNGLPFEVKAPEVRKPVNINDLSEDELREILVKAEKDIEEGKTESFSKAYENLRKEFDL
ncbi:MAG: type II toxin-antitoxin system RelB/DinJ family antitoxin [Coprobacillus sp.]|nr:type II toxin-antitoxin system RelB/DinJ family antitoxin [Coprobacillus sp.]